VELYSTLEEETGVGTGEEPTAHCDLRAVITSWQLAAGCDSEVDWLLGLKMTKMNNRCERMC